MSRDRSCNWSLNKVSVTCISAKEENLVSHYTASMTPARARFAVSTLNLFPSRFLHDR